MCVFLSVLKKSNTLHSAHVWRHKDVKAQRDYHVAARLPRL